MLFKRDMDFAIRILYCLYQNNYEDIKGVTLSDIAQSTGVPRTAIERICKKMEEKSLIFMYCCENSDKICYSSENLTEHTLLDVVEAIEGTGKLFAVFDKRTDVYRDCEEQLLRIQKRVERILRRTSLGKLFGSPAGLC